MKRLPTTILIFVMLLNAINNSRGQSASYGKMMGIWQFIPDNKGDSLLSNDFTLFGGNKSISITYWRKTKKASTYGNPFSYFGFWTTEKRSYPKRMAELDSTGSNIFFYDFLGQDYDLSGNILSRPRTLWVSYNEDEGPTHEPAILRFYRTGTPSVYVRAKSIPDSILLALKQNPESWKNYADFVGMIRKKVRVKQAIIYQSPGSPTKAYLIAGDEVQLLADKSGWYRIRYYGKNVIEGWINQRDLE